MWHWCGNIVESRAASASSSHTTQQISFAQRAMGSSQWDWAYAGVNASVPRNAGPECAYYLTARRHLIEDIFVVAFWLFALKWAICRAKPLPTVVSTVTQMTTAKKILLVSMTFTLGLELGFKLSSRSVIYILNPCHITTIMQVIEIADRLKLFITLFNKFHSIRFTCLRLSQVNLRPLCFEFIWITWMDRCWRTFFLKSNPDGSHWKDPPITYSMD